MKEALGIFQEVMGRISVEGSGLRAGGCLLQHELYYYTIPECSISSVTETVSQFFKYSLNLCLFALFYKGKMAFPFPK